MRRFKLKVCTFHVILLIFMELCFRSTFSQSEKEILLQFKGNVSNDPYNSLNSWGLDRNQCGEYNGVLCNSEGNVEKIVLWNMSLEGVLSPSLSKLKSLRILSLYGNRFTGNIPLEFGEFQNLWKLNLSSHGLVGSIPEFLGTYKNLRLLDLSRNGFTDEIPDNLFTNCFKMKFVSLSNNNLTGSIPASMSNCFSLIGFDFSFNDLSGLFPEEICGEILGLVYVSLRRNSMVGNVQEQVLKCRNLQVLDLGSNAFDGLVPFDVVSFQNLSYFNASFNQFVGEIPDVGMCSDRMEVFDVSGNGLVGEIPVSIANCRNMRVLDLGFNKLDGGIPVEIVNLKKLSVLRLGDNVIQGTIPNEISSIEFLQVLDLHNLKLSGGISGDLSKCRFLLELDLSSNSLQGEIPQTLNNMTYLTILDLHRNRLNGTIPVSLGELLRLQYLDLSENSFAGPIPPSLGNLTLLTHFNLSSNNLSGYIPLTPVIQKFGSTAYSKNPSLCGVPLDTPCSATGDGGTARSRKTRVLSVSAIVAIVAAVVILCGVCIICVMNIRARKRKKDESFALESTPPASTDSNLIIGKLVLFSKSLPSKYEDWEAGTKALLDKDCLIGGGAIGTVYKSNFEGGISIAVKKLETLGRIRNQDEFEQEIGRLGNLHHPNLVAFQGYYWSSTMQLILSEFVSNGNLYQHLHGYIHPGASTSTSTGSGQLNWSRRFQIAVGTARALAYLHHDCKPQVLHLNIKSTNILLDERYEPKLSDYGLLKLLPLFDSYGLAKFHTAVGYVAPELACQSLTFSDKCDVYSFGIILLELVTGKKPVESPAASEVVVLCDYVRGLLEEGSASLCFDRSLQGFVESELIQVMKLGLICTSEMPSRRPSMAEVVQVLETIRSG